MDRPTVDDLLSKIPERLRCRIQIGGIPVGYIDMDRDLVRAAANVRAHRQDRGQMMLAAVVSQDAVDSWTQGMQNAADLALLSVAQNFGDSPTAIDAVIERLIDDAISPLLKEHRYCAICGLLIRRQGNAKTCGKPECRKKLLWGKENVRARTRDNAAVMRQHRDRKEVQAFATALRKTGSTSIPDLELADAEAIATTLLHGSTTVIRKISKFLKSTGDGEVQKAATALLRYRRRVDSKREKR